MPTRNLRPGSSLGEKAVIPFRDPLVEKLLFGPRSWVSLTSELSSSFSPSCILGVLVPVEEPRAGVNPFLRPLALLLSHAPDLGPVGRDIGPFFPWLVSQTLHPSPHPLGHGPQGGAAMPVPGTPSEPCPTKGPQGELNVPQPGHLLSQRHWWGWAVFCRAA